MNFDEFKTDALRTESKPESLNFSRSGLAMLLSAGVHMAKIMDAAKKTMFYGKPLDADNLREAIVKLQDQLSVIRYRAHDIASPTDGEEATLHTPNLRITHGAIGMFGESGELLEAVMKSMLTGELDLINIAEETGDCDWYKAIIHDESGVSEEASRAKVIAKLKKRYGDKFSNEAALSRDLAAERRVLEETATAA